VTLKLFISKLQILEETFGSQVSVMVGADDGVKVRPNWPELKCAKDATGTILLVIR
jgi:hypothetical protein